MKKQKMKRLFCLITVLATLFSATHAKAAAPAAKDEPEALTVEKAVQYAIANSNELKKMEENAYIAEQSYDKLLYNFNSAGTEEALVAAAVALTKNEVASGLAYPNIENQKKSLEITITRYFSTIQSVERDLELYDKKLELEKRELEISKVKAELGLISKASLETATLAYEKNVANRASKVKAISDAYKNLALIMGVSDAKKFTIKLDLNYKKFKEISLDSYISHALSTNLKIIEAEENYRVAKYEHEISRFDSDLSEEASEIKLHQSQRDISDLKAKLESTLTTYYDDLLSLELSYELSLIDYSAMEKQLDIKKTQLELGKITQLEVDKYEYDMRNAYNEILKIINSHELKVLEFENPQLL